MAVIEFSQTNAERLRYLQAELEVWGARRARALEHGAHPALRELYLSDGVDEAIGAMVREKRELEAMHDRGGRRVGKRRPKRTDVVVMEKVVAPEPEAQEAPVEFRVGGLDLPF